MIIIKQDFWAEEGSFETRINGIRKDYQDLNLVIPFYFTLKSHPYDPIKLIHFFVEILHSLFNFFLIGF
jgi:hypothetical protein